ncbi:DUF3048 domain-containing protein, partial [bacterium]|nr:DUF3048 domain-containing protein [bacterium]
MDPRKAFFYPIGLRTLLPAAKLPKAPPRKGNTIAKRGLGLVNTPSTITDAVPKLILPPSSSSHPQIRQSPAMRPLAIMIENHNKARPQTGLQEAEVVYEIPVEGGITRFM